MRRPTTLWRTSSPSSIRCVSRRRPVSTPSISSMRCTCSPRRRSMRCSRPSRNRPRTPSSSWLPRRSIRSSRRSSAVVRSMTSTASRCRISWRICSRLPPKKASQWPKRHSTSWRRKPMADCVTHSRSSTNSWRSAAIISPTSRQSPCSMSSIRTITSPWWRARCAMT